MACKEDQQKFSLDSVPSLMVILSVSMLTLSVSKCIFWYFHTLEHLNGSSSFNIHQRLPNGTIQFKTKFCTLLVYKFRAAQKTGGLPTWGKSVIGPKATFITPHHAYLQNDHFFKSR